jgi:hypothetical protein
MSRRINLPGADELFRTTAALTAVRAVDEPATVAEDERDGARAVEQREPALHPPAPVRAVTARRRSGADRRPTGRERHEEKITVYVSADELLDLEHARLTLRGEHGLAVDRGRIVREALAVVLADLDAKGESSILVRRLRGR